MADNDQEGLDKPLKLSPELQNVLEVEEMSRLQVTKEIWNYIDEHDLQDSEDKRTIVADDKLRDVFEQDEVTMFEMPGLLSDHLTDPDE